ncbi:unnamed protein product [Rhizophagus irregularis]|nr:unnamed protein product [Rhizophagus irregularis]
MEFKNWIIKFIDTEHFQGLRNIKKLISQYVYPGASLEHCLGVAHLSRSLIKRIQETQPELEHDENEADSTLKISDSNFDANEYLKMDDTILNKIEYSNDPKEINEEKIIAYQNNDGLKVDDIIVRRKRLIPYFKVRYYDFGYKQNSNDTPTNPNNSLPAHYNLEDKVEEDRMLKIKFKTILDETHYYLDNPSNLSQKKNVRKYCG